MLDVKLDGEKTVLYVTTIIFSSMWIFTNTSTSNGYVLTKSEKQHMIWKLLSIFEKKEVWCWSRTPKQTDMIMNVRQQTKQVKAEDWLSLHSVGQHCNTVQCLFNGPASLLPPKSFHRQRLYYYTALHRMGYKPCLYQAKWITCLPFQCTVYKVMRYKMILKPAALAIHLQQFIHTPPGLSARSWMLELSPPQAFRQWPCEHPTG